MKKIIGIIVCILALLVCAEALADVAIDATYFPDANFRQYILDAGFDANKDGTLSSSEIARVKYISCAEKEIKSLKGIEHFTALTDLWCSYNQLTNLDVSKNTALTELRCYGNQLTSLDVSKNTALTTLWCYTNKLTSLDVSKNTALTELQCWENQLTSLDVSKNTALKYLSCEDNQLKSLDVSKCPDIVDIIKKNPRDLGTYWEYGNDPLVSFDKSVKVYLGNGEYIEPATKPADDISDKTLEYSFSGSKATVTGLADKNASSVTIPSTVKKGNKTYKVTKIRDNAFKGMKNLKTVSIGKNVKTIGKSSFKSCKKLEKVTIGSSVTTIGKDAFNGCKALKSITIKTKKLTADSIGANAFKGTPKKATIKVPKDKVDEYKTLLRAKGVNKKAKIKK